MTDYTDKELADALVEMGIIDIDSDSVAPYFMYDDGLYLVFYDKETLVRDWRVAGACLERMTNTEYQVCQGCIYVTFDGDDHHHIETESLPRAIIAAFVDSRK